MRFLHTSDLHFGKYMGEIPLADSDQRFWKDRFIEIAYELRPDAIVIAGDIYDRSNPSNEAVKLFDELLCGLSAYNIPVLIIAGNHDSGQKLCFAGDILEKENIYIAGVPSKKIKKVTLKDKYGNVNFWLVPYIFPAVVNSLLDRDDLHDYDSAFRALLEAQEIDFNERNVIAAHQTVIHSGKEPDRGGSETAVAGIGGIDNSAFDGFEYAALGHIHRAQYMGRPSVRYAGSPLCYHFDEAKFPDKGVVMAELSEKDAEPVITPITIAPLHNVRITRGTFKEICENERNNTARGEYLRAELTEEITDAGISDALRSIAREHDSVFLEISSAEASYKSAANPDTYEETAKKSLSKLFEEFAASVGSELDDNDKELISELDDMLDRREACENYSADAVSQQLINSAMNQEVRL